MERLHRSHHHRRCHRHPTEVPKLRKSSKRGPGPLETDNNSYVRSWLDATLSPERIRTVKDDIVYGYNEIETISRRHERPNSEDSSILTPVSATWSPKRVLATKEENTDGKDRTERVSRRRKRLLNSSVDSHIRRPSPIQKGTATWSPGRALATKDDNKYGNNKIKTVPRRHRHIIISSEDSPIQRPPPAQHDIHEPEQYHKHRKRASPSSSSADRSSAQDEHRYEKRARHKTRQDKYETNRGGPARRKSGGDETKPEKKQSRAKDGKKKKDTLATAKDIMGNFSSKAIHNDRLTIQPSLQAGIFGNSKTGRTPGDLSFLEMNFLKEDNPPDIQIAVPKRRVQEQKKKQKEVEDIQMFFSHSKPQPRDPSKNDSDTRHRTTQKPNLTDTTHQDHTSSNRGSKVSPAATYLSWSISNHSPKVPDAIRTPESVRQRLIETGVYRGLSDIDRLGSVGYSDPQRHSPEERAKRMEIPGGPPNETTQSRAQIAQQAYFKLKPSLLPTKRSRLDPEIPYSDLTRPVEQTLPSLSPMDSDHKFANRGHNSQHGSPGTSPQPSQDIWMRAATGVPHLNHDWPLSHIQPTMPTSRPQSRLSRRRESASLNKGHWLLNTDPSPLYPYLPSGLAPSQPELFNEHADALGKAKSENMRDYIQNIERDVLGDMNCDNPHGLSAVPTHGDTPRPYLAPFFRNGPAQGFEPSTKRVHWSSPMDWFLVSPRHNEIEAEHSYIAGGFGSGGGGRHFKDSVHQPRNSALMDGAKEDSNTERYWRPNMYGL